jgi:serine/threonine-protein kinase
MTPIVDPGLLTVIIFVIDTSAWSCKCYIEKRIGEGGMAVVFLGRTVGAAGFERLVAIKCVRRELCAQPGFTEMFVAEARTAARLAQHPNIVNVQDFRIDEGGEHFLVMEDVDGIDLATLAESGHLPWTVVNYVMVEMLRGLAYAHSRLDPVTGAQGVIHLTSPRTTCSSAARAR